MASKRIVIIGMGDTGLLAAVRLSREFEVIGVSTKPCMVSGQELGLRLARPAVWRSTSLIAFDRYRGLDGVEILHGRATSVDTQSMKVQVALADGTEREVSYDALLIASGVTNGFWRDDRVLGRNEVATAIAEDADRIAAATSVAVVGGGPSGVSVAINVAHSFPEKQVHLLFGRDRILPGYHDRTRRAVTARLLGAGVHLHPKHRVALPERLEGLGSGPLTVHETTEPFAADVVVWAVGRVRPHSAFLPPEMLDASGFVKVRPTLQVEGHSEVFAVGDIAATDPNRSSARNQGYETAARNIRAYLRGNAEGMKAFSPPPAYRWGSIDGLQADGLRVYFPNGHALRFGQWLARNVVFRLLVARVLFRGIRRFAVARLDRPEP